MVLDFPPGHIIHQRFRIISKLGDGYEGEVYLVEEIGTGIERAAKFFYPERNKKGRDSRAYAKKLHKLRHCSMVIHYYSQDTIYIKNEPVIYLISDFIEGEKLSDFVDAQPKKRLHPYLALHFLYALIKGVEEIHLAGEYHGDIHEDNIIIERQGLGFDLKLVDLMHLGKRTQKLRQQDILDSIRLFYDVMGGKKQYAKLPGPIKEIICGLKKTLILEKFPTATRLRQHLETFSWN
jgi:serine/threonine protein kinase